MGSFQSPITIAQAIERIKRGDYLLPSFQREFVWSAEQVENLFDSLMKDYPFGSMLFWKVRDDAKSAYKFYRILDRYVQKYHSHNEPIDTSSVNDFDCVLDGQQRLTALYIGLCGSYAYHEYYHSWDNIERNFPTRHLYLNLTKGKVVSDSEEKQNFYFHFLKDSETNCKQLYVDSKENKWYRVGDILTMMGGISRVLNFCKDNSLNDIETENFSKLYSVIWSTSSINYYEEDKTTPDTAVNIFVRINSGGTVLSYSDMLMSMCIAGWTQKDARTEIHRLVDSINSLGFNITKDYVLKAFLYLYRKDVRFRIKAFDNQFIKQIEEKWDDISAAIQSLFHLLKHTYSLTGFYLTSYNATLPILYYIYHKGIYADFEKRVEYKQDRDIIRNWLLKALLFREFGSSADNALQTTRKAFTDDVESNIKIKNSVNTFPADEIGKLLNRPSILSDELITEYLSYQKENRYAFVILALLYPDMDFTHTINLDHIHPQALCSQLNLDKAVYNSILNLQFLYENENKSKGAKSLSQWVEEETQPNNRERFLENHLIPNIDLDLDADKFNAFIAARRVLLTQRLQELVSR